MTPSIGFLLGRPPGPLSLLPAVWERVREAGLDVRVELTGRDGEVPARLFDAGLVVLRGLSVPSLDAAAELERAGIRCCNRVGPSALTRDKALAARRLREAGIPMPGTVEVAEWSEVVGLAGNRRMVVKPVSGSRGRGVLFLGPGPVPEDAATPGPYLVQEMVPGDGVDRKLYVVGDRVAGVLRTWPAVSAAELWGRPFRPGPELRRLARSAGDALGLEIYGVDVVVGPGGPVVVDVNAFPGFKGVATAVEWLAGHLLTLAASPAAEGRARGSARGTVPTCGS